MPRTGRPTAEISLSDEEREVLGRYERRRKTSQQLALRSRIVLECAEGKKNTQVATAVGITPHTVGKWRARFAADRIDGLVDAPRPGQPRKVGDDKVEEVIVATLETLPKGASRWSTRDMPKRKRRPTFLALPTSRANVIL